MATQTPRMEDQERPAVDARALRREVLGLAWPASLEMIAYMSIWMVDTAMVGRLGSHALSAVGMAGQVYWTIVWAFAGLGAGTVAITARSYGAGDAVETSRRVTESISVATALALILFGIVRLVAGPASHLISMGEDVQALMREYLVVMSYGALPVLVQMVGSACIRSTGDTRTPLIVSGIANGLNIVGDWALIFGNLGLPALGVRGAAVASVASAALGCILVLIALASGKNGVRLVPRYALGWRRDTVLGLIRLSVPASAEAILMDGARSTQMFIMTALGDVQFAANQVAVVCESLSFMPGYGLAIASSIMVGQSLGARNPVRARQGVRQCLILSIAIMGAMGLLFLTIPGSLVGLFTRQETVAHSAVTVLRLAGLFQPMLATTDVLLGALRGAGDTKTAMRITAFGTWGLRIPLTCLVVRALHMPLAAVWVVNGLEWTARAFLATRAFRAGRWITRDLLSTGSPPQT
ncbi:MAG: MATE family efflux transporter [Firmicutes bacterium]|nr:MATE family efflux transporter [Bacillota bacterium]